MNSDFWLLASDLCSLPSDLRPPWHAGVPPMLDEGGCPSARRNLSSHLPLWSYYDYNMVMELVGVAQLKSKLSHYLAPVAVETRTHNPVGSLGTCLQQLITSGRSPAHDRSQPIATGLNRSERSGANQSGARCFRYH